MNPPAAVCPPGPFPHVGRPPLGRGGDSRLRGLFPHGGRFPLGRGGDSRLRVVSEP
jgi:hypothetical protein